MTYDWLVASGVERTYRVVSAINTLSINAKLIMAGMEVPFDTPELEEARSHLAAFMSKLEALIQDAERNQEGIVLGTDPQLGELAIQFLAEKRRASSSSGLYKLSIIEFNDLVNSEEPAQLPTLIMHLRELRALVERRSHADINHILGDL